MRKNLFTIFFIVTYLSFSSVAFADPGPEGHTHEDDIPKTEQIPAAAAAAELDGNLDVSSGNVNIGSFEICTTGIFSDASAISLITTCPSYAYAKLGIFALNVSSDFFDLILDYTLKIDYMKPGAAGEITPLESLWTNIRNLTNALFIVGIVWIAGLMVLGNSSYRKSLIRLIIIALVINFSLLTTRIIVDAGNVTALLFYNSIEIENSSTKTVAEVVSTGSGGTNDIGVSSSTEDSGTVKSITGAFLAVLNPGVFFGKDVLTEVTGDSGDKKEPYIKMMILLLSLGTVSFMVAWNFLKIALAFLSRGILLILYAVISPLAFASYFIPGNDYLGKWFKNVIQVSFCITVYMFFVYLIFVLILGEGNVLFNIDTKESIDNLTAKPGGATFNQIMTTIVIQYAIVIVLLSIGAKYAKQFCDKVGVGDMALGGVKKIGGLGLGVATGGAALAARGTLGRLATRVSNNNAIQAAAGKGGVTGGLARTALYSFDNLQNAKFGTDKGYKAKLDEVADKEDKFRTRSLNARAQQIVESTSTKDAGNGKSYAEITDRGEAIKIAKAEETKRVKETPDSGVVGTLLGGLTGGVGESKKRYTQKEQQDVQDKKNKELKKDIEGKANENKRKSISEAGTQTNRVKKQIKDRIADGVDEATSADTLISSGTIDQMTKSVQDGGAGMDKVAIEGMKTEVDGILDYRKSAIMGMQETLSGEKGKLEALGEVKNSLDSGQKLDDMTRDMFGDLSEKDLDEMGLKFKEDGSMDVDNMNDIDPTDFKEIIKRKEKISEDAVSTMETKLNDELKDLNSEVDNVMKNTMTEHRSAQNDKTKSISERLQTSIDNATEELQKAQEFGGDVIDLDVNLDGALNLDDELIALRKEVDADKKAAKEGGTDNKQ